jgi:hypothetical protein
VYIPLGLLLLHPPPFPTLPRYCPFPSSTSFYSLPKHSTSCPASKFSGLGQFMILYHHLLSFNTIPSSGSWFTLPGYKYSTQPQQHIIRLKHSHLSSSHQSSHHLNILTHIQLHPTDQPIPTPLTTIITPLSSNTITFKHRVAPPSSP